MSDFALDAPIAQVGVEILEVEAEIVVEIAGTRPRRIAKESGVAIERREGLPRRGALREGGREGFTRHQKFVLLQPEEVADAPVIVARPHRRSRQVAVELLPVHLQPTAHLGHLTVVVTNKTAGSGSSRLRAGNQEAER